jgi:hypothetical protein
MRDTSLFRLSWKVKSGIKISQFQKRGILFLYLGKEVYEPKMENEVVTDLAWEANAQSNK